MFKKLLLSTFFILLISCGGGGSNTTNDVSQSDKKIPPTNNITNEINQGDSTEIKSDQDLDVKVQSPGPISDRESNENSIDEPTSTSESNENNIDEPTSDRESNDDNVVSIEPDRTAEQIEFKQVDPDRVVYFGEQRFVADDGYSRVVSFEADFGSLKLPKTTYIQYVDDIGLYESAAIKEFLGTTTLNMLISEDLWYGLYDDMLLLFICEDRDCQKPIGSGYYEVPYTIDLRPDDFQFQLIDDNPQVLSDASSHLDIFSPYNWDPKYTVQSTPSEEIQDLNFQVYVPDGHSYEVSSNYDGVSISQFEDYFSVSLPKQITTVGITSYQFSIKTTGDDYSESTSFEVFHEVYDSLDKSILSGANILNTDNKIYIGMERSHPHSDAYGTIDYYVQGYGDSTLTVSITGDECDDVVKNESGRYLRSGQFGKIVVKPNTFRFGIFATLPEYRCTINILSEQEVIATKEFEIKEVTNSGFATSFNAFNISYDDFLGFEQDFNIYQESGENAFKPAWRIAFPETGDSKASILRITWDLFIDLVPNNDWLEFDSNLLESKSNEEQLNISVNPEFVASLPNNTAYISTMNFIDTGKGLGDTSTDIVLVKTYPQILALDSSEVSKSLTQEINVSGEHFTNRVRFAAINASMELSIENLVILDSVFDVQGSEVALDISKLAIGTYNIFVYGPVEEKYELEYLMNEPVNVTIKN